MEKPILIARAELAKDIADVINRSRLPLIIVEPILGDLLAEVQAKIQQQYEKEKEEYEVAKAKAAQKPKIEKQEETT